MVKKVVRYAAVDGREFASHSEAWDYERGLQIVKDLQAAIIDAAATTVDEKGRPVYNIPPAQALTFADLLATSDLYTRVRSILK